MLNSDEVTEALLVYKDEIMYAGHYTENRAKRESELEAALAFANDNPYGEVPLIYAVSVGMEAVIKIFLSQGVDVETVATRWPHKGMLPIHVAAVNNQSGVIELLLGHGAGINTRWMGMTALMLSEEFEQSDISISRLLLDKGIELNAKDFGGNTALMYAARLNLYDHFMAILAKGADPLAVNNRGETVFMVAARAGDTRIVDFLLMQGANVNETDNTGSTAMDFATSKHDLDMLAILMKALWRNNVTSAPAAAEATTAMYMTSASPAAVPEPSRGRPRFSMTPGSVPGAFLTQTPPPRGINDIIPDKSDENMTLVMLAARNDDIGSLDALLAKNADIDEANDMGRTALMQCAERGSLVTVNALLARGANVTLTDAKGHAAVFYAAQSDHTPVVELLRHHIAATSGATGLPGKWIITIISKARQIGACLPRLIGL
ncbi:ankyrin repeat domain-containing protein [Acerihabitans arboris]|uniref:ankyrin repeat domain-containing protein n=1 Tax=Acerihabitans arboris TaxID=2691583 RepID=UPI00139154C0|nr:ankyrin repeat domain-containing protein [Acerihabitans arboris]